MLTLLSPTSYFLPHQKNLLAFSAGIDSSALFFLLIEHNIPFDIAIVDYGTREQSKAEVAHAEALAKEYGLACYTAEAPRFYSDFEARARKFRYDFFERLIAEHGYDNLLTAHQLNDQLEWLLMRLTKGAGVRELVGMAPVTQRKGYRIVRPLLDYPKAQLLTYLEAHDRPYFVDESNRSPRYERNRFREVFSDPLIAHYAEGIARSFGYLREEKQRLDADYETVAEIQSLRILKLHSLQARSYAADTALKQLGYLLSAAQREEIANTPSLVIGGKWAVACHEAHLYIAPYTTTNMPKKFKERCRINKIPAKIRPYLYEARIDPETIRRRILFDEERIVDSK